MRYIRAVNRARQSVLGTRIGVADRWWLRLRGLHGRLPLAQGEGLLLRPCPAVHMFGMSCPLDVAFLDRRGTVLALYPRLAPGARTRWHGRTADALELPAGVLEASGTLEGDTIDCSVESAA